MSDVNWLGYAQAYKPYQGLSDALAGLNSGMDEAYKRTRQEEIDALNNRILQQKIDANDRDVANQEGLRQLLNSEKYKPTQKTVTVDNPLLQAHLDQYTPEALDVALSKVPQKVDDFSGGEIPTQVDNPEYARGLAQLQKADQYVPATVQQTVTTPADTYGRNQAALNYMVENNMTKSLEAFKDAQDVTSKIDERHQKGFAKIMEMWKQAKASGIDPESFKPMMKSYINNVNAMAGRQVFDANAVDTMDFRDNGIVVTPMPDGSGYLATATDEEGKLKIQYIPPNAAAKEQWSEPYEVDVRGKRALVRRNLITNKVEPVVQDTSVTVHAGGQRDFKPTLASQVDDDGTALYWDAGTRQLIRVGDNQPARNPGAKLSGTEREKTAGIETMLNQLDRVNTLYKPEYVGIMSGRVGALTSYADREEAGFRQVLSDVKDSLLRARSGAQINEQEYARLSKLVPSESDSDAKFSGKMQQFRATLEEIQSQRAKANRKGGYVTPKAGKQLDAGTAKSYLQKAGGDKAKARELAKADGWSF